MFAALYIRTLFVDDSGEIADDADTMELRDCLEMYFELRSTIEYHEHSFKAPVPNPIRRALSMRPKRHATCLIMSLLIHAYEVMMLCPSLVRENKSGLLGFH